MSTFNIILVLCLLAYTALLLGQAAIASGKTKTSSGYFSASGAVGSLALFATVGMSMYSGVTYYGYPSSIYSEGIGYLAGVGAQAPTFMFLTVGYRLWMLGREYGFTSPAEYLRARYYDEKFGYFVALLLFIFIIPYVGAQIITIGDGISISTNGEISYSVAVGAATIIICAYVFLGGMSGLAGMDIFHFFLGYGALAMVLYFITKENFDGSFLEGLRTAYDTVNSNPETAPILSAPGPNSRMDWKGCLNLGLASAVATIVWPQVFTRCFIAKGKQNFKIMAIFLPACNIVIFAALAVVGAILAPAILGADTPYADGIMPILSTQYAPKFVSIISLLCLCAFAVSTIAAFLLSGSQFISKDLYLRIRYNTKGEVADDKKAVTIGRIGVIIIMIFMMYIAFEKPESVTENAYKLASPFFGMILPATIGGIYWRRGTREGAWAGTIIGLIVVVIFTFFVSPPWGFSAFVWGLAINALVYIIVSLCTKCPEEVAVKYVDNMNHILKTGKGLYDDVDEDKTISA